MCPCRRVFSIGVVLFTAALASGSPFIAQASGDAPGTVHFVRAADSSFDVFTSSPSAEIQAWIRAHMWRMTVWSPYFDEKTRWYANGWFYQDAYAIYENSALASEHPEWILRDSAGNKLYIPWGCSNGSCPQYAGDISNPAYRRYWIDEAQARLAHGYRGLFVDDVNMEEQTGNGEGQHVAPTDPTTGQPMSDATWRAYMAEFMAEIRAALPNAEIVHNVIWFANSDAGSSDPSIRREIESANYICLERGVNDSGLTGGNGQWSVNALFAFVDEVHALGRGIVLAGSASDVPGMEYNLASYFLLSSGDDAVSASGQTPDNWWSGWNVNLGEATGGRRTWNNVLRRDFTGGMVLVNPPEARTQTISLPTPMQEISGNLVTSVTLGPASGVVLAGDVPAPTPVAGEPAKAVPTQTILTTTVVGSNHSPGSDGLRGAGVAAPHTGASGGSPGGSGQTTSKTAASHRHPHHPSRRRHAHGATRGEERLAAARSLLTRISGMVLGATRGTVAIQVERRRGGHWLSVKRLTVSVGALGQFVRLLHLQAAVPYRVRAVYSGASGYLPSSSDYRLVVLHAR